MDIIDKFLSGLLPFPLYVLLIIAVASIPLTVSLIKHIDFIKKHWKMFLPTYILFLAFIIFGVYYLAIPYINKPPADKLVIRIANFQPVAEDAKNASKNFPHRLMAEIIALRDPEIDVRPLDENIDGFGENELKAQAKKVGLREDAHMVIFGKVRCNDNFPDGCTNRFDVSTVIVLTEGPIIKEAVNNSISGKDYIELSYLEVSKIRDTVRFIQGIKKFQDKEYIAARQIFGTLPADDPEILFFLGAAEYFTGGTEAALVAFDKVIKINPEDYEAHNNKGVVLNGLGRHREALDSFNKAIIIRPSLAETYNNKGNALKNLGTQEEAIVAYNEAIRLKPDYAMAYVNKAFSLNDLGRYTEALNACEKAISISPDLFEAYNNKGITLKNLRKYEEAIAAFDEALRQKPDNHVVHNNKGATFAEADKHKEALVSFNEAIKLKPDYADAHYNKGLSLGKLHYNNEALSSFDEAIRHKPDYADAHVGRGVALHLLNRKEEAKAAFAKAKELDPNIEIPNFAK